MQPDTDKRRNGFAQIYAQLFRDFRDKPIRILEIGVLKGGSLWLWTELFPHPETLVVGIDLEIPEDPLPANAKVHVCDQNDPAGLQRIVAQYGPFDLIFDDGCHFTKETRLCFETLFSSVKDNGYYIIEDWAVGYWDDRDVRYRGMVEVVTEIMQQAPAKSIDAFLIALNPGRTYAVFRKGTTGWKH
jgi:hypothetical protein